MERDQDYGSEGVPGPYLHVDWDTAKDSSEFRGTLERKEQSDVVREVSGSEIQTSESGIPVLRGLRRHGRENEKKIQEDIQRQDEKDKAKEQLTMQNL